ncbi:S41 family peptidase [Gynurincola endophyticus]|uniref:S41 family peptidase n=1 Tax=Gynurincola endophyticus TaxID=2479004 RepID=UPI000F8D0229|nr:S41 family peptidase [Gynurincola endophyticus]
MKNILINSLSKQLSFLLILTLYVQFSYAQKKVEKATAVTSKQSHNQVLDSLIKKLHDFYVFPETAIQLEKTLRLYHQQGYYNGIDNPKSFADTLTQQLRRFANDNHLNIYFRGDNNQTISIINHDDKEEVLKRQRFKVQKNFGFAKADILEGNIGYLKIESFFPVAEAAQTAAAAMNFLTNTDALIIDLRPNHGGDPAMVQYLASYFFDTPVVHLNDLYWREGNKTVEFWTLPDVAGNRYLHKPVYLLTDQSTFSAGEEFTYDLQSLKRAITVGTATGGGANPGREIQLTEKFSAFIPTGKAINPITKTNWEGAGVQPDFTATKEEALRFTHIKVLQQLAGSATDERIKAFFTKALEKIQSEQ